MLGSLIASSAPYLAKPISYALAAMSERRSQRKKNNAKAKPKYTTVKRDVRYSRMKRGYRSLVETGPRAAQRQQNFRKAVSRFKGDRGALPRGQEIAPGLFTGVQAARTQQLVEVKSRSAPTRISRCELITEVAGVMAFNKTIDGARLGPGNSTLFPWLSGLEGNWSTYRFTRLKFIYLPETATTSTGSVAFSYLDDPSAASFASFTAMQSQDGTVAGSEQLKIEMSIPRSTLDKDRAYYTSDGTVTSGLDLNEYFLGTMTFAQSTSNVTTNIGFLYVDYEIILSKPTVTPSLMVRAPSHQVKTASATYASWADVGTMLVATNPARNSNNACFPLRPISTTAGTDANYYTVCNGGYFQDHLVAGGAGGCYLLFPCPGRYLFCISVAAATAGAPTLTLSTSVSYAEPYTGAEYNYNAGGGITIWASFDVGRGTGRAYTGGTGTTASQPYVNFSAGTIAGTGVVRASLCRIGDSWTTPGAISALADDIRSSWSTVQAYMATMAKQGYVSHDDEKGLSKLEYLRAGSDCDLGDLCAITPSASSSSSSSSSLISTSKKTPSLPKKQ